MNESAASVKVCIDRVATPIGPMVMMVKGGALIWLEFEDHADRRPFQGEDRDNPYGYSHRIRAYFSGELTAIDTIPTESGGTSFQERVWA